MMPDHPTDKHFLLLALKQAWLGRGMTAPNPAVGAVAVQNHQVIAEGYHRGVGHDHAEKVVLDSLPESARDVTLYITLEPCNHWGRTPPCTDAIIAKGIQKVVYAYHDPNPVVAKRNTPHILKAHGIEVVHHPLDAIQAFYQSYAHWLNTQKPWVTVKVAQSLDGKIAEAHQTPIHLSNAICDAFTHQSRRNTDVILTSTQTVISDDPQLTARCDESVLYKPVAIVGKRSLMDIKRRILQEPKQVLHRYTTHDIEHVLCALGALGYHDVWVEVGAQLFQYLHQHQLVQTTHLYMTPHILGHEGLSLYNASFDVRHLFQFAHAKSWKAMGDNGMLTLQFQENAACLPV